MDLLKILLNPKIYLPFNIFHLSSKNPGYPFFNGGKSKRLFASARVTTPGSGLDSANIIHYYIKE